MIIQTAESKHKYLIKNVLKYITVGTVRLVRRATRTRTPMKTVDVNVERENANVVCMSAAKRRNIEAQISKTSIKLAVEADALNGEFMFPGNRRPTCDTLASTALGVK